MRWSTDERSKRDDVSILEPLIKKIEIVLQIKYIVIDRKDFGAWTLVAADILGSPSLRIYKRVKVIADFFLAAHSFQGPCRERQRSDLPRAPTAFYFERFNMVLVQCLRP